MFKQALSLAGLAQAASLVNQIATTGLCTEENLRASVGSIFKLESNSIEDVFGGQANEVPGLSVGLRDLTGILNRSTGKDVSALRYMLGLLHLEGKLRKQSELLYIIRNRLEELIPDGGVISLLDDNLLADTAKVYEDTISTLNYRIHVSGNRLYLENPANVNKIRVLLLAGVRSAMLWRQIGGRRWHLFWYRKRLLEQAQLLR